MRVLIACEFSGIVREAFAARGHDAWSCDLLPCERPGNHIQGDVLWRGQVVSTARRKWDLLIAFPPCTFLCNSGVRWLVPAGKLHHKRHEQMKGAADFFAALYHAPVARICIENPIMHKYARDYLLSVWKVLPRSQQIQPWQFGHGETKATCLWLKNLPLLKPTRIVSGRVPRIHHASPGPDRWKERSRTLPGIAEAMAEQWAGKSNFMNVESHEANKHN